MRAVVYERYGNPDVLEMRDVDVPTVGDDDLLVRVHAASLNRSDWETLTGSPAYVRLSGAGLTRPKQPILGTDFSGVVEAVGPGVTRFVPGDAVFGDGLYAGVGAFADYLVISARAPVSLKPPALTHETAAALPQAGMLALQGLRARAPVQPGERVLVVGACGGGGTFAVQLARSMGADVTGVDSFEKQELMRSLGAGTVIDYLSEQYPERAGEYDRILDFVGSHSVVANRRVLASAGVYLVVGGPMRRVVGAFLVGWVLSRLGNRWLGVLIARPNAADLDELARLVEAGTIAPAIDEVYPLAEVAEAMRRLGAGQALGKLVVVP